MPQSEQPCVVMGVGDGGVEFGAPANNVLW